MFLPLFHRINCLDRDRLTEEPVETNPHSEGDRRFLRREDCHLSPPVRGGVVRFLRHTCEMSIFSSAIELRTHFCFKARCVCSIEYTFSLTICISFICCATEKGSANALLRAPVPWFTYSNAHSRNLRELGSQTLRGCHRAARSVEHFHRSWRDPDHGVGCTLPYVGVALVKLFDSFTPARLRLWSGQLRNVSSMDWWLWSLLTIGERLDWSTRSCAKQG